MRDTIRKSVFIVEDQMDSIPDKVELKIKAHEGADKRTCLSVNSDGAMIATGGAD